MNAREYAAKLYENAKPRILDEEDQTWELLKGVSNFYDQLLMLDWNSNVPGSGAPESIMVAAVAAMENRGYIVEDSSALLEKGLEAYDKKDFVELHKISAKLKHKLLNAVKNEDSHYWSFKGYESFEDYIEGLEFPVYGDFTIKEKDYKEAIKAAWLGQLIGAAMGTQLEGYTRLNIRKSFGEVEDYLREPNTYNDDLTFELAFLEAFEKLGYDVSSKDIALEWVGLVPVGWSAEELALRNIKNGVFPPKSATFNNPFNEWIGAQMRGAICGMLAPADPYTAAELAWKDASVSHVNNGILGEVFNAVLASMAFVEKDTQKLLLKAIDLIPNDSEYYSVLEFALEACKRNDSWEKAMEECEKRYRLYNWIHAYPNACAEVVALYYGEGSFKKTLTIICQAGIDVDCNAAQILAVLAIQNGIEAIPKKYYHGAFNKIQTYMRSYKELTLEELVEKTVAAFTKAKLGRN